MTDASILMSTDKKLEGDQKMTQGMDRGQLDGDGMLGVMAAMIMAMIVMVFISDILYMSPEISQPAVEAVEATADVMVGMVTAFVGIILLAVIVSVVAPALIRFAIEAKETKLFPTATFGDHPIVRTNDVESIDGCLNCGIENVPGIRTDWGRYKVYFGFVWDKINGGIHEYCHPCDDDPIEASLRRGRYHPEVPIRDYADDFAAAAQIGGAISQFVDRHEPEEDPTEERPPTPLTTDYRDFYGG